MRIAVEFHAAAKELAGVSIEHFEFNETSVSQAELRARIVQSHQGLRGYIDRMRLAVNEEFARTGQMLADGDHVDVLPPVAGGSGASDAPLDDALTRVLLCDVTDKPIEPMDVQRVVDHPTAGGIAMFSGVVRNHADGKPVARLQYEAHKALAIKETQKILTLICAELSSVRIAAVHRVGDLKVGDVAVVVAASAAHRDMAFRACRDAIDRIKETVPIWKKEWGPDGSAHWVNLEPT